MSIAREQPRRPFDPSKEYVMATNSRLPVYDGSLLVGVRPVSVKLLITQSGSEYVTWSDDHTFLMVTHSLNCVPIVTVIDENGMVVTPHVEILSGTSFVLDFEAVMTIDANHPWICIVGYGADYTEGQVIPAIPVSPAESVVWGSITGNILNQTDLLNKFNSKGSAPILGQGAPTSSTVGELGQFYINTSNPKLYYCSAIGTDNTDPQNPVTTYNWTEFAGGSSGGGGSWGEITGTLANQTDLKNAMDAKANLENGKVPSSELPVYDVKAPTDNSGSDVNTIVSNGVATIPWAGSITPGLACMHPDRGIQRQGAYAAVIKATTSDIDDRGTGNANSPWNFRPIVPNNLDYAVRSVVSNTTVIPAATSAYNLLDATATTNNHCYCYRHIPESAPTYTLPAVSDTTVVHEIVLTVRFSSTVPTYYFEDASGNAIIPLTTPTIVDGSVIRFLCTYEPLLEQWVIVPVELGTYVAPTP